MFSVGEEQGVVILKLENSSSEVVSLLRQEIRKLFRRNKYKILIDFSGVTIPSSSLLSLLLAIWERARKQGGSIALCNLSFEARAILQVAEIQQHITCYSSRDQAIQALREG